MPITDLGSIIPEGQIDPAIARDTEIAAAIGAHVAGIDPHPSFWSRIVAGFLSLTGGQKIEKNNPATSSDSYHQTQNHLTLTTNNASNPTLGFHRTPLSATALYHLGYGNDSLRIVNADGYNSPLLHNSNHVDLPGMHSVRCSIISTVVAAAGVETVVDIGVIPSEKIVGINVYILDNLGVSGIFYILKGGGGDFNPTPRVLDGWIRIPGVINGSQLVGDSVHFLVWHIP